MKLACHRIERMLAIGLMTLALYVASVEVRAQTSSEARLAGTFMQLTEAHATWTATDWQTQFAEFERLGLHRIVVQWSVYDNVAFYPSAIYRVAANAPLETLLALADQYGLRVHIGLTHDSQFWSEIKRNPNLVSVYLGRRLSEVRAMLPELMSVARKHASFSGFYIADEIDDLSWQTPERREILLAYLRAVREAVRTEGAMRPVAISGFSNAAMSPLSLAAFWDSLLRRSGIELLLFQDGVGAGKLDVSEVPIYLNALHLRFNGSRHEVWTVVELFQHEAGTAEKATFQAIPAPFARIQQQLALAAEFTSMSIAFSVPDYMSPRRGAEQSALFQAYLSNMAPQALPP